MIREDIGFEPDSLDLPISSSQGLTYGGYFEGKLDNAVEDEAAWWVEFLAPARRWLVGILIGLALHLQTDLLSPLIPNRLVVLSVDAAQGQILGS